MVLYQTSLDDMISIDPLTRLNNRKQLSFYYEQWQHREETTPLYLLLIDADKFKAINDTYGHIQGDAALERIADTLRKSCGKLFYRANIARYGGDEFVMLVRADDEAEIEGLKNRINQNLAEMNREADTPYDLSVSIGIARVEREDSLKEVIEKADKELYEEKRSQQTSRKRD
jgi:diguanylate cyclase (GGDEF)-like protein